MSQDEKDTQIIGYAEPWIVSPGDPVGIKVCRFASMYTGSSELTGLDLDH